MDRKIYLDHAATTPVDPRVAEAMMPFFTECFGNPSSQHSFGRDAKETVESVRGQIALLINADPDEIVFTSGGTESDNFAIKGSAFANMNRGRHIITTAIEHHAVLDPCSFLERFGFETTYIPVNSNGIIDPADIENAITDRTILVSVMHANNEMGSIQPISEISSITKKRGIPFHTDAVQTFGHIPVDVKQLGVDMLSISGHKIYGPKGIGVIYIKKGTKITPFMHGGGQERGLRSSTLNVPGIAGLGKAAEIAASLIDTEPGRQIALRDYFIKILAENPGDLKLNGHPVQRLPNNINISFNNTDGEYLMAGMDIAGIACSTGSACSSGGSGPSHVLHAMGLSDRMVGCSIRLTIGRSTTSKEIDTAAEIIAALVKKARAMTPNF
ncbi:MAG: cysteine desulfurase family protein [Dissulfurispiraceae bacterium]|nr:cysteine desulfurase family protein [Dissulfurispiraceae bacterium]